MTDTYIYSFKDVNVIWGIRTFNDWGEGDDVITVTTTGPQWNQIVGARGAVVQSQSSDNSCSVVLKFLKASKDLKYIYQQYNIDRETNLGAAPMYINNKVTGEKQIINLARIQQYPVTQDGQNSTSVPVTFLCNYLTIIQT